MKESEEKFNVGGLNASENVVGQHRHQDMINDHLDRAMSNILPGPIHALYAY